RAGDVAGRRDRNAPARLGADAAERSRSADGARRIRRDGVERARALLSILRRRRDRLARSAPRGARRRVGTSEMTSAEWHVPIVLLPDREGMTFADPRPWQLRPRVPHLAAKAAFVIDGRAISYAESVLEVIEHYRLGALVGEPTAGTNGNINPFEL